MANRRVPVESEGSPHDRTGDYFRSRPPMDAFFDDAPDRVAERLVGKTLRVGRKRGTILKVHPQDQHDNANWIERRPLFGPDPVDAYVAPYRSGLLLFLRTGQQDTCVRIDAIESKGERYTNPTQVCRALDIEEEKEGWVSYDGEQVAQVRWY